MEKTAAEPRYEVEYFAYDEKAPKDGSKYRRYGVLDYTSRLDDAMALVYRDAEIRGLADDFGGATVTRFVNDSGTVIIDMHRDGTIEICENGTLEEAAISAEAVEHDIYEARYHTELTVDADSATDEERAAAYKAADHSATFATYEEAETFIREGKAAAGELFEGGHINKNGGIVKQVKAISPTLEEMSAKVTDILSEIDGAKSKGDNVSMCELERQLGKVHQSYYYSIVYFGVDVTNEQFEFAFKHTIVEHSAKKEMARRNSEEYKAAVRAEAEYDAKKASAIIKANASVSGIEYVEAVKKFLDKAILSGKCGDVVYYSKELKRCLGKMTTRATTTKATTIITDAELTTKAAIDITTAAETEKYPLVAATKKVEKFRDEDGWNVKVLFPAHFEVTVSSIGSYKTDSVKAAIEKALNQMAKDKTFRRFMIEAVRYTWYPNSKRATRDKNYHGENTYMTVNRIKPEIKDAVAEIVNAWAEANPDKAETILSAKKRQERSEHIIDAKRDELTESFDGYIKTKSILAGLVINGVMVGSNGKQTEYEDDGSNDDAEPKADDNAGSAADDDTDDELIDEPETTTTDKKESDAVDAAEINNQADVSTITDEIPATVFEPAETEENAPVDEYEAEISNPATNDELIEVRGAVFTHSQYTYAEVAEYLEEIAEYDAGADQIDVCYEDNKMVDEFRSYDVPNEFVVGFEGRLLTSTFNQLKAKVASFDNTAGNIYSRHFAVLKYEAEPVDEEYDDEEYEPETPEPATPQIDSDATIATLGSLLVTALTALYNVTTAKPAAEPIVEPVDETPCTFESSDIIINEAPATGSSVLIAVKLVGNVEAFTDDSQTFTIQQFAPDGSQAGGAIDSETPATEATTLICYEPAIQQDASSKVAPDDDHEAPASTPAIDEDAAEIEHTREVVEQAKREKRIFTARIIGCNAELTALTGFFEAELECDNDLETLIQMAKEIGVCLTRRDGYQILIDDCNWQIDEYEPIIAEYDAATSK